MLYNRTWALTSIVIYFDFWIYKYPYIIGLEDLEVWLYNRTWALTSIAIYFDFWIYKYPYIIGLGDLEVSLYKRTWCLHASPYNALGDFESMVT